MKQGETLFGIWGGVRRMARDLNRPASTVHGWKKEGRVPANEQPYVLQIAEELGLPITAEHIIFPLGRPDVADAIDLSDQPIAVPFNRTTKMQRKDID
jgi:hypothetical protein